MKERIDLWVYSRIIRGVLIQHRLLPGGMIDAWIHGRSYRRITFLRHATECHDSLLFPPLTSCVFFPLDPTCQAGILCKEFLVELTAVMVNRSY